MRLWEENLQGLGRTLGEDLGDFGRGFMRTLGENLSEDLGEDSRDFGRGFRKDLLADNLQGFAETLGEDLQGFHETLGEDLQVFMRLWERIHKYSGEFGRGFARIA